MEAGQGGGEALVVCREVVLVGEQVAQRVNVVASESWFEVRLCRAKVKIPVQVSSYYRLPEEEQRLQKNPMCEVFPRIGGQDWSSEMAWPVLTECYFQHPATTGGGGLGDGSRI